MNIHDFDICDGAVKGLAEDFGRQKLAEREESIWDSFERLKKRLGSMDTIWETNPHRLNEAGLVRHSDNSVLTEDTDSFIIGDRVWVGGTKPGQIAYIGETQFAPGEWAGIVLDAPIGKNDGSVGGVRYFQCEARRGVFSRLTRLTRTPLPGADESFIPASFTHHISSTPLNNGTKSRGASPLSPTGSTKSLRKSPSLSTSNTSLASTTHIIDFKVGDRVIIKSSQGSKVGTLRYMGTTSFASGEWCGVELDEPRGKNDGAVEGTRYFECKPQFGLFAPVSKVSKSPLKYKPGNCVLHSGAKLPPSGMRRTGSKESMTSFTSMTSSLASATSGARRVRLGVNSLTPQKVTTKSTVSNFPSRTPLQDVLREKQLHIEQLLKERNLERAEFTRAANQADNAEQQLATLQAEYEHYRAECESKLKEYSTVLSHLNVDRGSLLSQLEDEKRKNEDLQFKFEEAAITKGDIEVSNQTNIHRIKDLEERLTLEKQKVELLEHESSKLFEAEEELVKSREEIDSLKSNLQHLTAKREATAKDNSFSSETSSVITQQIQTKTKNLKIAVTSQSADLEQQLEESKKKSVEHLENCEKYQIEITSLKSELSKVKNILQEQSSSTSERIKTNAELESSLRSEIERLKSDLARKSTELQTKDEELKLKEDEIRGLKTLLETTEIDLKAKTVDVERYQSSKQESEDSYNKEIDYLKKILKEKVVEKEEVEKVSTIEIAKQKSKLEDASRTIALHLEEIQKLKSDLSEAKTDIERNSLDVHERHTRQIAIKESELMAMAAELQQKNEEISKCSIVTTKLEDDICIKNGIIEKLKLELESFKKRSESEERSMLNYTERISVLQLSIGDLQRKLASTEQLVLELQEQKARLENELETVIASSGDYSVELQKMNAAVVEKELMITTVRNEYLQKLQLQQSNEQQLQLQLQRIKEDSERLEHNMREKLRISQESEDMLRQRCESANGEAIKVRDDLMNKVNQLQRLVEEKDFALKVSAGDHTENTRYLKEQLDRTTSELQKTINNCQYKINELSAESINSKNVLAQKTQELIESEAKLKHFMAQSQLNEEELRRLSEEQAKKLQFELSEKNAQVQQFLTELELLKRDCQSRNINIAEKDHRISELSVQLENTLKLVKQLQVDKDNLQLAQMEANKQCAIRNQQCTDLVNQVALLTEKAKLGDKAAQELQMHKVLHQQLIRHLQITETQKQNLVVRLEEEAKKNGETKNCYNMLELAKNIQTSANNEHTQKIMELQQILETTKLELQENQNQLEAQKNEILSLQNELLSAQQSCGPNVNPSNTLATQTDNSDPEWGGDQQLMEEKQFAEGQIQFLNSIIADMQRKSQEQQARIQLLESGYSPAATEELRLFGVPQVQGHQRPPRIYCDICELFDDHETEDCPLQATGIDVPSTYSRRTRAAPSNRSYCEICEIFGHCTEDCKEDQTF
ncbi:hypothetical protein RN001_011667 [Aquatica leii]|uniref:CAP-Gly domain-containing protein n=1 Tax=Aquatica leii TaxID=1421715 RepID=A0AAN7NXM3_9COLE|nr:hypothetical protein RN001_011667 [Aquatica leii]